MGAAEDTHPPDRLDAWLGAPAGPPHHRGAAAADPDALWNAASGIRLCDTRTLGRVVRWRMPGLRADLTYGELFHAYPLTVLDDDNSHLVAGLCGRILTLGRDYPRLDG